MKAKSSPKLMYVSWLTLTLSFGLLFVNATVSQEVDQVKEQIFKEVEEALQGARDEDVPLLSPNNFAKADQFYQKALKDYDQGEKLKNIQENLNQAMEYLDTALETSRLSRIVLERLIGMKEEIKELAVFARSHYFNGKLLKDADFREEQSYYSSKAERKFKEAAMKIEDGNVRGARSIAWGAEKEYRRTAIEALKKGILVDVRKKLKDVKDTIPKESSRKAKAELDETEDFIEEQKRSEFVIKELFAEVNNRIQQAFAFAGIEVAVVKPPDLEDMQNFKSNGTLDTKTIQKHMQLKSAKYRGFVTDNQDPNNLGRIKARVPALLGKVETGWALPCVPYAGKGSGVYMVPQPGTGVWIEFEAGDISRPIWSGCWWGDNQLPQDKSGTMATPPFKIIRSEKGLMVTLDDNSQTISLSDSKGGNMLSIEVQQGQIKIQSTAKIVLAAPQIELVDNASHPLVFGDDLLQYLTQLVQIYQTHVHPGEVVNPKKLVDGYLSVIPAPPLPPFPVPMPSMLSKKVTTE